MKIVVVSLSILALCVLGIVWCCVVAGADD